MKNLYTLTVGILLATTTSFAQNGNLQNGGFENWTDVTMYDYPTDWRNSNQEEYRGVATVTQSTDASDGTYSIKLTTQVVDGDTLSGYVFHGEVGQNGSEGGVPYSDNFDHIEFAYKFLASYGKLPINADKRFIKTFRACSAIEKEYGINVK